MISNYHDVIVIARQDGVKYRSEPFEFTGNLDRKSRIAKLINCPKLRDETKVYFSDQFIVKNNEEKNSDVYEINIFTWTPEPDILIRLNKENE